MLILARRKSQEPGQPARGNAQRAYAAAGVRADRGIAGKSRNSRRHPAGKSRNPRSWTGQAAAAAASADSCEAVCVGQHRSNNLTSRSLDECNCILRAHASRQLCNECGDVFEAPLGCACRRLGKLEKGHTCMGQGPFEPRPLRFPTERGACRAGSREAPLDDMMREVIAADLNRDDAFFGNTQYEFVCVNVNCVYVCDF